MNYREYQEQVGLRVEVPAAPVYLDLHRVVP